MSRLSVKNCVETYQRARLAFVQSMSGFADKPHTTDLLKEFNCVDLIVPLLHDLIPSIRHVALVTLAKILCSGKFAQEMLELDVMKTVLKELSTPNHKSENKHIRSYKKTALHMLGCVAEDERFEKLLDKGLKIIIPNLQDPDTDTRATTALALGKIAKLNQHLAERVVQLNALPGLTQVLASPEPSLQQAGAFAMDKIAYYNPFLARRVETANAIPLCIKALNTDNAKVKQDALLCLANIAKHSSRLAGNVSNAGGTTVAVEHLSYPRPGVQRNAATLLQNICMQNLRLAKHVEFSGGVEALLCLIETPPSSKALTAMLALGYLATQSEQIAEHIIEAGGVQRLRSILEGDDGTIEYLEYQAVAAWTLGEMGKHSVDNTAALSRENILSIMFSKTLQPNVPDVQKAKYISALNLLIPKCENWRELERMFKDNVHQEMLPSILSGLAKVLACHGQARRSFIQTDCLKKLQEIKETPDIAIHLKTIYACFPEEVLQYLSPDYVQNLLKRLDDFKPRSGDLPKCASTKSIKSMKSDLLDDEGCLEESELDSSVDELEEFVVEPDKSN